MLYEEHLEEAKTCIENVFNSYEPGEVAISFNGGKDSTVIFHLIRLANVKRKYPIPVCYAATPDPFPQLESFIKDYSLRYANENMHFHRYEGPSIKESFKQFLMDHPKVKAIFIGVRRTDPYCKGLNLQDETDNGWPCFIRIHPIINWDYQDIWTFLGSFNLDYCELYEEGYTSIGSLTNTTPNPLLLLKTANNGYAHARTLADPTKERLGRL